MQASEFDDNNHNMASYNGDDDNFEYLNSVDDRNKKY